MLILLVTKNNLEAFGMIGYHFTYTYCENVLCSYKFCFSENSMRFMGGTQIYNHYCLIKANKIYAVCASNLLGDEN